MPDNNDSKPTAPLNETENNANQKLVTKVKHIDWHFYGWLFSKLAIVGVLFFVLLIYSTLIYDTVSSPYNYFLIGMGACVFAFFFFRMVRVNTYKPKRNQFNVNSLTTRNQLLETVMLNLNFEINKFEGGADYYFQQVNSYKYTTVILAGVSTIVLGLDLSGVKPLFPVNYTLLAKNIALVLGAIITVMTTMYIFWNLEKYWLQNKIILQRFRQLKEEIELADKRSALTVEQIDQFCERFKTIKFEFYKYWEGVQAERNKQ